MEFTNGVMALVVMGNEKKFCKNSNEVYEFLDDRWIDEESAMDAQAWTELACVGETYNETEFDIYMETIR